MGFGVLDLLGSRGLKAWSLPEHVDCLLYKLVILRRNRLPKWSRFAEVVECGVLWLRYPNIL